MKKPDGHSLDKSKLDTSGKILLLVYAAIIVMAIVSLFSNIKTSKRVKHSEPEDDYKDYLVPFGN